MWMEITSRIFATKREKEAEELTEVWQICVAAWRCGNGVHKNLWACGPPPSSWLSDDVTVHAEDKAFRRRPTSAQYQTLACYTFTRFSLVALYKINNLTR